MSSRDPQSYSDKEIADALAALDAAGGNVSKAARETGIPRTTLSDWKLNPPKRISKPEVTEEMTALRHQSRLDLGARLKDLLWDISDQFTIARLKGAPINHLSTLFAVLFDKLRLLEGKATAINETRIERHRWAETKLQEIMREYKLTREQALEFATEFAPTIRELISAPPQAETGTAPTAGQNSEAIS